MKDWATKRTCALLRLDRRLRLRHLHRGLVRVAMSARRRDERAEQRMRRARARLVLRMELAAEEPGVVFELHDLHELAVRREARHAEAALFELRDVLRVGLV